MQKKEGISLIVLVITIIVMIVLAGAIILSLNNAGIIGNANTAVFKQNVNNYLSELELYYMDRLIDNSYMNIKNIKATATSTPSIVELIPSISDKDKANFRVAGGKLIYVGADRGEYELCRELDINIDSTRLSSEQYNSLYEEEIEYIGTISSTINTSKYFEITSVPNTNLTVVPSGVKILGAFSFSDEVTKTVILPESLTTIGEEAFYQAEVLESLILPSSVDTIEENAFFECGMLNNIELSEGLKRIEAQAFSNCSSLKDITIPKNVTTIGGLAFENCNNLKEIYIESLVLSNVAANAFTTIAEGSTIYVRSEEVANYLVGKYDVNKTTISKNYNW